jgi:CRISPR-associated protein Csd1
LNIIEHRPLYIFGLNYDKGRLIFCDKTNKAAKSHKCFAEGNLAFIKDLNSDIITAYRNFIINWKPEEETENPQLMALGKEYAKSYYCFALDGHPEIKLHEDNQMISQYLTKDNMCTNSDNKGQVEPTAICAVSGENAAIARIHEKIKGIKGGNSTGCVLICVKNASEESYGKKQAYNSNVSDNVMKKYTTSLNALLSDRHHCKYLDDMTIVYWAMSEDDKHETDLFSALVFNDTLNDAQTNDYIATTLEHIKSGKATDLSKFEVDENVIFYIAAFTPNSSRVSLKFIYKDKFGNIFENGILHQRDMVLENTDKNISIRQITRELVSPKSSKEKVPPPLISALIQAILHGTKYPETLLETAVRRIKTDSDEEGSKFIKFNSTRISIIKACLNRKARFQGKKEEITLALNTENNDPAYLCGRLFAFLERIQQKASNDALNRTIKDSFFASACSKPSTVFPRLMILSQNHLSKMEYTDYWNKQIAEVVDRMTGEFPHTLSLDEQGKFIIGYYQQYQSFFKRKENNAS